MTETATVEATLPVLKGTPKQVAWAEGIRPRMLDTLALTDGFAERFMPLMGNPSAEARVQRAELWETVPEGKNFLYDLTNLKRVKTLEVWREFAAWSRNNDDASFWVDMRGDWGTGLVMFLNRVKGGVRR